MSFLLISSLQFHTIQTKIAHARTPLSLTPITIIDALDRNKSLSYFLCGKKYTIGNVSADVVGGRLWPLPIGERGPPSTCDAHKQ